MNTKFELKTLLDIIFKVTKKNANIMADCYLLKDKSIISKWKKSSVVPRNDDIGGIIKFVLNESTGSQQQIIRDNIEQLVIESSLKKELKEIILGCKDFSSFLTEAISVSISAKDNNLEPQTLPFENNLNENTVTGRLENKNGRYKGTLEFDLVIPNDNSVKSVNSYEKTGIEFNGKVNLNPKSRIINAAKYLKKTSVLGLIFACIVSGSLIAHSNNQRNNSASSNYPQDNSVNKTLIQEPTATISPVITPEAVIKPTVTIVATSTPAMTPKLTPETVQKKKADTNKQVNGNQNQNNNNTTTEINNKVNNEVNTTEVNINGNENIFFNGNNNVIDIN